MPTVGTPNQGGRHDSRRFNKFGRNPLRFGRYWATLLFRIIRVPFSFLIDKGNDEKGWHWIDCRGADDVPVPWMLLQG